MDHHRSFADIIEFSNGEFYENKLRIATDYRKLNIPSDITAGIHWIDVKGKVLKPNSKRSVLNNEEIQQVIMKLNNLVIENNYRGSIGVFTPFRAQADKIREEIEKLPQLKGQLYGQNDFLVNTVHKFQDDEKDIIIFSAVISQNTPESALNFLKNKGNLFNVAITRARTVLIVVGDKTYCSCCKVPYMEHFVSYVNNLENKQQPQEQISILDNGEYPQVSNMEQVSHWEKYLYTELYKVGILTTPQYPVDKYKLDLAIITEDNRKLDIEVDGEMYHRDWDGELCYRDQLRNQRLFELGWNVKRFWVYQIRDQLDWCIEQIRSWLK